jgi:hypothetical protein
VPSSQVENLREQCKIVVVVASEGKKEGSKYAGHMDSTICIVENSDSATTYIRRYIFLPLVMRNFIQ